MKQMTIVGALLAVVGFMMLAYPFFTTQQTKDVANIGPLHIQENEQQTRVIPTVLSGGILAVGVVLLAGGLMKKD